jgi:hypothetical protein
MILEIYEPPDHAPRQVAENPDSAKIENTVKGLPWSDITFIVLKIDENNWIEGSGSLNPEDGLSARYSENGKEYVAENPPKSLEVIVSLLQSYASGDGKWKKMIIWK